MDAKLGFEYDREGDILYINKRQHNIIVETAIYRVSLPQTNSSSLISNT